MLQHFRNLSTNLLIRVPTVRRNREKVGNIEMLFSRSGKSGKKSGIQSIVTSKVELRNYSSYRNGRPLFGKCSAKEIQTDRLGVSRAMRNGRKI